MSDDETGLLDLVSLVSRMRSDCAVTLDRLRGPSVPPSPVAMRLEQFLTQAESFIHQAHRLLGSVT